MSCEDHLGAISLIKTTFLFLNALLKFQLEIEEETLFFKNTLLHLPPPLGGDATECVNVTFPLGACFRASGVWKEDGRKNGV